MKSISKFSVFTLFIAVYGYSGLPAWPSQYDKVWNQAIDYCKRTRPSKWTFWEINFLILEICKNAMEQVWNDHPPSWSNCMTTMKTKRWNIYNWLLNLNRWKIKCLDFNLCIWTWIGSWKFKRKFYYRFDVYNCDWFEWNAWKLQLWHFCHQTYSQLWIGEITCFRNSYESGSQRTDTLRYR